ncbi:MAG: hypothetical protein O3C45_10385, partial [Bacteroidetes bacterium]|nr:hypothetical protein [Bacteroidota bacterium]
DQRDASDLIKALSRDLPAADGGWLARRHVSSALTAMLPRMMVRLHPQRRLAVVRAFRGSSGDPSERSVFLVSVRRALETEGLHAVAHRLTPDALEEAMRRYLAEAMAPLPEALEQVLIDSPEASRNRVAKRGRKISLPTRIAIGLLVILSASAIGTWITAPPAADDLQRAELFDRLSVLPDGAEPSFRANEPEQVERYIRDRLGMEVSVPRLDGGNLAGVSVREVANLRLPMLHYSFEDGRRVLVTVMDYRQIDAARAVFLVDRSILDHIAEFGQVDVRNAPEFFRVTWRFRDDIYLALQSDTDPELRQRFQFE